MFVLVKSQSNVVWYTRQENIEALQDTEWTPLDLPPVFSIEAAQKAVEKYCKENPECKDVFSIEAADLYSIRVTQLLYAGEMDDVSRPRSFLAENSVFLRPGIHLFD